MTKEEILNKLEQEWFEVAEIQHWNKEDELLYGLWLQNKYVELYQNAEMEKEKVSMEHKCLSCETFISDYCENCKKLWES